MINVFFALIMTPAVIQCNSHVENISRREKGSLFIGIECLVKTMRHYLD